MDDISKPTEKISVIAHSRDKVALWLSGHDVRLSEKENEMLERSLSAHELIHRWGISKAKKMLLNMYDISRRSADALVGDAMYIYGSRPKAEKSYWRQFSLDKLTQTIAEIHEHIHGNHSIDSPEEKKKFPQLDTKLLKSYIDALSELRRVTGFDKDAGAEIPNWAEIGKIEVHITTNVEDLGIAKSVDPIKFAEKLINEMAARSAVDTDFHE